MSRWKVLREIARLEKERAKWMRLGRRAGRQKSAQRHLSDFEMRLFQLRTLAEKLDSSPAGNGVN
jgi:hypothetical protein